MTRGKRALFASVGAMLIVAAVYFFASEQMGLDIGVPSAFGNVTGMILRSASSENTVYLFNATLRPAEEESLAFSFIKTVDAITVVEPSLVVPFTVSGMDVQADGKSTVILSNFTGVMQVEDSLSIHGKALGFSSNNVKLSPKKVVTIDADELSYERISLRGIPPVSLEFDDVEGSIDMLAGDEQASISKKGGKLKIVNFVGDIDFVDGSIYLSGEGTFRTDAVSALR